MPLLLLVIPLALIYSGHSSSLELLRALDRIPTQSIEASQRFQPKQVANSLVCANQLLGLAECLLVLFFLASWDHGPVNQLFMMFPIEVWQFYLLTSLILIPAAYLGGMGYLRQARVRLAPGADSDANEFDSKHMVTAMNAAWSSHLALAVVGPGVVVANFFITMQLVG